MMAWRSVERRGERTEQEIAIQVAIDPGGDPAACAVKPSPNL